MSYFFRFESSMERTLALIPMLVRMKLDTCGIKLSLAQWNQFPEWDRRRLFEQSCEKPVEVERYRAVLSGLIQQHTGELPRFIAVDAILGWQDDTQIPQQVLQRLSNSNLDGPTLGQWQALTPAQRFALIKLTRPGHDSPSLFPAMQEFALI